MIEVVNLFKNFGKLKVLKILMLRLKKAKSRNYRPFRKWKEYVLRCLNCMEDPTSGSIIFNGTDIADMKVDINLHRRHMGMVFNNSIYLIIKKY